MMERAAAARAGVLVVMDLKKHTTQPHAPVSCAAKRSHHAACEREEKFRPNEHMRPFDVRREVQYAQHILLGAQAQAEFEEIARRNCRADKDAIVLLNAANVPALDHSTSVYGCIRDVCNGQVHPGVQVREICSPCHHVYRVQKRQDALRPVLGLFAVQNISAGTILGQYIGEVRMRGENSSDESEHDSDVGEADTEARSEGRVCRQAAVCKRVGAFSMLAPAHEDLGRHKKKRATIVYDVNLPGYNGDIPGCPKMYMSGQTAKNEMSEPCLACCRSLLVCYLSSCSDGIPLKTQAPQADTEVGRGHRFY
jgi:hypothetical protein